MAKMAGKEVLAGALNTLGISPAIGPLLREIQLASPAAVAKALKIISTHQQAWAHPDRAGGNVAWSATVNSARTLLDSEKAISKGITGLCEVELLTTAAEYDAKARALRIGCHRLRSAQIQEIIGATEVTEPTVMNLGPATLRLASVESFAKSFTKLNKPESKESKREARRIEKAEEEADTPPEELSSFSDAIRELALEWLSRQNPHLGFDEAVLGAVSAALTPKLRARYGDVLFSQLGAEEQEAILAEQARQIEKVSKQPRFQKALLGRCQELWLGERMLAPEERTEDVDSLAGSITAMEGAAALRSAFNAALDDASIELIVDSERMAFLQSSPTPPDGRNYTLVGAIKFEILHAGEYQSVTNALGIPASVDLLRLSPDDLINLTNPPSFSIGITTDELDVWAPVLACHDSDGNQFFSIPGIISAIESDRWASSAFKKKSALKKKSEG